MAPSTISGGVEPSGRMRSPGKRPISGDRCRCVVSPRLSGDIHSSSQPVFGLTFGRYSRFCAAPAIVSA